MSSGKILITTRSFRKTPGQHQQILLDAGYEVVNSPYDRACTAAELAELIVGMDGAILGVDEVTAEVFAAADNLKVVSRYGVGIDSVDVDAASAHGIVVTNTPGGNSNSVAELTITLMLALARNIPLHDRNSRKDEWGLVKGRELAGSTLGILGMGRIGQRVAEIAHVFGITLLFHDPYPPGDAFMHRIPCELSTMEHIISESDFVSLHLPLLPETQ
ncbi:MAG: NAD(P)-dependent oxidoreductase, partial [Chloroflexota bacterium]